MRKRLILAAFSIFIFGLSAGLASAQVPTAGNVFFGYTYYSTTLAPDRGALNGLQGTLEGKVLPFVGIVADITGQYGQLDLGAVCSIGCVSTNISTHVYEAMFGPRIGVPIGKFRPFAEFEVGVAHVSASTLTDTNLATAIGGGVDYKILRPLAWRVQGDYVHTHFFGAGQSNERISTGIVLRF